MKIHIFLGMEEKIAKKKKTLKELGNGDLNNNAFASFSTIGLQPLNQKPRINPKHPSGNRKSEVVSSASKKEDDFFADFETYNKMNSSCEGPKIQGTEINQGNLFFGFNFNADDNSNIVTIFSLK